MNIILNPSTKQNISQVSQYLCDSTGIKLEDGYVKIYYDNCQRVAIVECAAKDYENIKENFTRVISYKYDKTGYVVKLEITNKIEEFDETKGPAQYEDYGKNPKKIENAKGNFIDILLEAAGETTDEKFKKSLKAVVYELERCEVETKYLYQKNTKQGSSTRN